eukprot:30554-Karenia_brevis.AAC.1
MDQRLVGARVFLVRGTALDTPGRRWIVGRCAILEVNASNSAFKHTVGHKEFWCEAADVGN